MAAVRQVTTLEIYSYRDLDEARPACTLCTEDESAHKYKRQYSGLHQRFRSEHEVHVSWGYNGALKRRDALQASSPTSSGT